MRIYDISLISKWNSFFLIFDVRNLFKWVLILSGLYLIFYCIVNRNISPFLI